MLRQLYTYSKADSFDADKLKNLFDLTELPDNIFTKCRKHTTSVKLKMLNYRILHNDIYTLKKLYKIGMINSPCCNRCHETDEDLLHLIYNCPASREIWIFLQEFFSEIMNETIILDKKVVLFGFSYNEHKDYKALNTIISKIQNLFIQIERPQLKNCKNLIIHQIKEIIEIEKMFMNEKKFKKNGKQYLNG